MADQQSQADQIQERNTLAQPDFDRLGDKVGAQLTEWLKLKTDQIEQKVDLRMNGLDREINAKLDGKPGHIALIIHTIAVIGIILSMLAFGGDRFDGGISASSAYAEDLAARARRDAEVTRQLHAITSKLEAIRRSHDSEPVDR